MYCPPRHSLPFKAVQILPTASPKLPPPRLSAWRLLTATSSTHRNAFCAPVARVEGYGSTCRALFAVPYTMERFHAGGEGVMGKYNEFYVHLVDEMHAALTAGAYTRPRGGST
jgi:hypothetical protein